MAWTQKFSDSFTDTQYTALPTHNAAWAQDTGNGTWRISTNGTSAGCTAAATARAYITGGSAPGNDQACQFTILNGSAPNLQEEEGLLLRFTDGDSGNFWGGTGYVSYIENDAKLYSQRLDGGGSHTQIAATNYTPTTGDVIRVEMVGSALTVLKNGTQVHQVTDATYTTGAVGMWCGVALDDTSFMSIDDFVAEEWSAAAGGAIVFNLQIG